MKNILKKALVLMLVAVMTVSNMSGIVIKAADNRPEKININPNSAVMSTRNSKEWDAYGNVIGTVKHVVYRSGESILVCYNLDGTFGYVKDWPNFMEDQKTYHIQYYFKDGSIKSDETKKSDGTSTYKEYNEKGTLIKDEVMKKTESIRLIV